MPQPENLDLQNSVNDDRTGPNLFLGLIGILGLLTYVGLFALFIWGVLEVSKLFFGQ